MRWCRSWPTCRWATCWSRDGTQIVGHAQVIDGAVPDAPELKSLAVVEHRQHEGIGSRLVEAVVARCRARQATRLIVATATADTGTVRFYERHGFRPVRVVPDVFVLANGYAAGTFVDGVELRDQVVLERDLRLDSDMARAGPAAMTIRPQQPGDVPVLLAVWRAAVCATHDFLEPAAIQALLPEVDAYLRAPGHPMWVLCDPGVSGAAVGFLGLDGATVASLFIAPTHLRRGGGRALMAHARRRAGQVLSVAVNAQNGRALAFYRAMGFVETGRSALDDQGRPYPLVHLRQAR